MKNTLTLYCLALIMGMGAACSKSKIMSGEKAASYFVLGSGGGFTGKYEIYKIHYDGRVEIQEAASENYSPYNTLPMDSTKLYFALLDELELQNLKFKHPDNMTWFIEVHNATDTNRVSWGDLSHPVRPDIKAFFKRVNSAAKSVTR